MSVSYTDKAHLTSSFSKELYSKRIGIVCSEWHSDITFLMLEEAKKQLLKLGFNEKQILIQKVPGSVELVYGAKILHEKFGCEGVILFGAVVRGETPHFDYVCQSVTQGVTLLNVHYSCPFIFAVLTTDNYQQALDRANGKHENKGRDATISLIKMMNIQLDGKWHN